jgi:hypothetical protein
LKGIFIARVWRCWKDAHGRYLFFSCFVCDFLGDRQFFAMTE